jgi:hypothetical protein
VKSWGCRPLRADGRGYNSSAALELPHLFFGIVKATAPTGENAGAVIRSMPTQRGLERLASKRLTSTLFGTVKRFGNGHCVSEKLRSNLSGQCLNAVDFLCDEGYLVLEASNADEAVRILEVHQDISFTDVDRPLAPQTFAPLCSSLHRAGTKSRQASHSVGACSR